MALEEISIQTGTNYKDKDDENVSDAQIDSSTDGTTNVLKTLNLEVGRERQDTTEDDDSTSGEQEQCEIKVSTAATATVFERINNFASKCVGLVSMDNGLEQQLLCKRLNVLSVITTLACAILLCIYIVRSEVTVLAQSNPEHNNMGNDMFRSFDVTQEIRTLEKSPTFTWSSIQNMIDSNYDKKRLHLQVLNSESGRSKQVSQPHVDPTHDNVLKIFGRPHYCVQSVPQTPENIVASNITHLYLSEMDNCHHYTKLILTRWSFPKVHHIKLHKMLIREQEFKGLTLFIDRHNETLHRVEIDDCFLCPSPICDAGLINFPEHDFQITITGRRESPEWI